MWNAFKISHIFMLYFIFFPLQSSEFCHQKSYTKEFIKEKLTRFVVQRIWEIFWSISLEDSIKHELYISEEYYLAAWCSAISKIALLFKTFGHIHICMNRNLDFMHSISIILSHHFCIQKKLTKPVSNVHLVLIHCSRAIISSNHVRIFELHKKM